MAGVIDDPHFRQFASSLEKAIAACGETDSDGFLQRQHRQVDTLVAKEKAFKKALIEHRYGERVYRAFVRYICETRRNILDARPYFRERQHIFTRHISSALRNGDLKVLHRFNFNYRFVLFTLGAAPWKPGSPVARLAREIAAVRNELVVMNMPLAISRARIFYSRTPKAHLSYMDLIQIACEGLMSGVDKFVPPFSKAFRAVAIGRMTGNFIENYSETAIHFFPVDKRKIYRANKLSGRGMELTPEQLARGVNKGVEAGHRTTPSEIIDLMAASSTVSADNAPNDGAGSDEREETLTERLPAPEESRPDVIVEREEAMAQLLLATQDLTILERKLLRLKGVQL